MPQVSHLVDETPVEGRVANVIAPAKPDTGRPGAMVLCVGVLATQAIGAAYLLGTEILGYWMNSAGATAGELGNVLTVRSAVMVPALLAGGVLADRMGRMPLIAAGLAMAGLGVVGIGVASGANGVIGMALLQAIAAGGLGLLVPGAIATAAERTSPRFQAVVLALIVAGLPPGATIAGLVISNIGLPVAWDIRATIAGVLMLALAGAMFMLPASLRDARLARSSPSAEAAAAAVPWGRIAWLGAACAFCAGALSVGNTVWSALRFDTTLWYGSGAVLGVVAAGFTSAPGRRGPLLGALAASIASVLLWHASGSQGLLVTFVAMATGARILLTVIVAGTMPTARRATGVGIAEALGIVGSIVAFWLINRLGGLMGGESSLLLTAAVSTGIALLAVVMVRGKVEGVAV